MLTLILTARFFRKDGTWRFSNGAAAFRYFYGFEQYALCCGSFSDVLRTVVILGMDIEIYRHRCGDGYDADSCPLSRTQSGL